MSQPPSDSQGGPGDLPIFVSDASAEAERLIVALRSRGYQVLDVPLSLLVSRVGAQQPALILCDVDADNALTTVHSLRDVPGGSRVDIIFLGEAGRTLDSMPDAVFHESSGFFVRPVDVYALLRKVEALIGPPPKPAHSSLIPPAQRGAVVVRSSNPPPRSSSNPPRNSSTPPQPSSKPARSSAPAPSAPAPASQPDPVDQPDQVSTTPPGGSAQSLDDARQASTAPPGGSTKSLHDARQASTAPPGGPRSARGQAGGTANGEVSDEAWSEPDAASDLPLAQPLNPAISEHPTADDDDNELPAPQELVFAPSDVPSSDDPELPLPQDHAGESSSPESSDAPSRRDSGAPSLPPVMPLGFRVEPDVASAFTRKIPQSEMSPELERLLAEAEQRVAGEPVNTMSSGPPGPPSSSGRLAPEDEVEAVLPAEVLEALDESLDPLDDNEDFDHGLGTRGGSDIGTGPSTGGGHGTGTHLRTGTGPAGDTGLGTNIRDDASKAGSIHDQVTGAAAPRSVPPTGPAEPTTPPGPRRQQASEAPPTPPAFRSRPPGPPSGPQRGTVPGTAVDSAPGTHSQSPSITPPPVGFTEPGPLSMTSTGLMQRDPEPAPHELRAMSIPAPGGGPLAPDARPTHAPGAGAAAAEPSANPDIPSALGPGDSVRALARAIRVRYSGGIAFESAAGIRRVVMRDGDFVTAAAGIPDESLIAFLTARGDLSPDAARLAAKLPQFGRHAGAALIAHGHLRQDDLWPVLRAHAEWLLGRIAEIDKGAASIEPQVPGRLAAEPAVFGGATGAEVLMEIVRRSVRSDEALDRLGGGRARLMRGPAPQLLGECALSESDLALVERAESSSVEQLLDAAPTDEFGPVLYGLVELGVLATVGAARRADPAPEPANDRLDEEAVRERIRARKALVEEGDYFAVLGVTRGATAYDIRRAYLELRRRFEPSRVLTAGTADLRDEVDEIVEVLDEAYEILRDQVRRERYRRALEASP